MVKPSLQANHLVRSTTLAGFAEHICVETVDARKSEISHSAFLYALTVSPSEKARCCMTFPRSTPAARALTNRMHGPFSMRSRYELLDLSLVTCFRGFSSLGSRAPPTAPVELHRVKALGAAWRVAFMLCCPSTPLSSPQSSDNCTQEPKLSLCRGRPPRIEMKAATRETRRSTRP